MSADADETRLRRGLILHALHAQFPLRLSAASLQRQVGPFYQGEAKALERDLAYLEQKGALELHSDEVGGLTVRAFSITPAGIDLVERTTTDPGITFARG